MALFLFPANSFGHKASSPSGVLAFVIYQGGIAVKTKESSISLCKNHARTAIIRCSVPTRRCWIIMRNRQRTAVESAARSLTCRWNLSASPRLSSVICRRLPQEHHRRPKGYGRKSRACHARKRRTLSGPHDSQQKPAR